MVWDVARRLLSTAVVTHLGESIVVIIDDVSTPVRGILTTSEQLVRLGQAHLAVRDARLTIRSPDFPGGLPRGAEIVSASGDRYTVSESTDNGEGVHEVILVCAD